MKNFLDYKLFFIVFLCIIVFFLYKEVDNILTRVNTLENNTNEKIELLLRKHNSDKTKNLENNINTQFDDNVEGYSNDNQFSNTVTGVSTITTAAAIIDNVDTLYPNFYLQSNNNNVVDYTNEVIENAEDKPNETIETDDNTDNNIILEDNTDINTDINTDNNIILEDNTDNIDNIMLEDNTDNNTDNNSDNNTDNNTDNKTDDNNYDSDLNSEISINVVGINVADTDIENFVDNNILNNTENSIEEYSNEVSENMNIYSNDNEDDNHSSYIESIDEMVKPSDELDVTVLLKNKLSELQSMATELDIPIRNVNGKKKTKLYLAQDIISKKNI